MGSDRNAAHPSTEGDATIRHASAGWSARDVLTRDTRIHLDDEGR